MEKIYKDGDEIVITEEVNKKLAERSLHLEADFPVGLRGKCYTRRFDRQTGWLCIKWESGNKTSVTIFQTAGLKFEHPDIEELDLMECPKELLSPKELVTRGLREMGYDKWTVEDMLHDIEHVMNDNDIVFYIP
jgi:hypothetical protein